MDAQKQLSRYLAMAETTCKRTLEAKVREKALKGECLICGKNANGGRGLCNAHYLVFRRSLLALPKKERIEFEEKQIRGGKILATGQLRQIKSPNPFLESAS